MRNKTAFSWRTFKKWSLITYKLFNHIFLHVSLWWNLKCPLLLAIFYLSVDHIKLMIYTARTQACCYCQRSGISVTHVTPTFIYTPNGSVIMAITWCLKDLGWTPALHPNLLITSNLDLKQMRGGVDFGILELESWWWVFAAQLQDFVHCIERQQCVPVHACMSHCIGMLAPGTQQLTALTSVNKLIAGDWKTTQPLC